MIDTSVNDRILFFLVFPASHYLFFVNYDYLTDALVVSFEATQANIPIYTPLVEAQVEPEIQVLVEIQSTVGS